MSSCFDSQDLSSESRYLMDSVSTLLYRKIYGLSSFELGKRK